MANRYSSSPLREGQHGRNGLKIVRAVYDFAVEGGAVGTIDLLGDTVLPAGVTILGGFVEVHTAVTSGGAGTLAISVEGAGDIVAAAAVSGAPWSTTGRKSVVPVFTGASSVRTSVPRSVSAVIATAALTAGRVSIVLCYVDPLA